MPPETPSMKPPAVPELAWVARTHVVPLIVQGGRAKVTVGRAVYPEPELVTVTPTTLPAVVPDPRTAVPVAVAAAPSGDAVNVTAGRVVEPPPKPPRGVGCPGSSL